MYTKDTVLVEVHALMYYSINDVRKAVYEVDDLDNAIQGTAQSQLKVGGGGGEGGFMGAVGRVVAPAVV